MRQRSSFDANVDLVTKCEMIESVATCALKDQNRAPILTFSRLPGFESRQSKIFLGASQAWVLPMHGAARIFLSFFLNIHETLDQANYRVRFHYLRPRGQKII